MFWRLYSAFVVFGLVIVTLLTISQVANRPFVSYPAVVVLAVLPAYLVARSFKRTLRDLQAGAERLAEGHYGEWVSGGSWRESRQLARSFNEMSERLAWQFDRLDAERHQLATILGGMVEGVVAVGDGQRILFANEAAGVMLEFAPEAAMGRPFWEMTRQPKLRDLFEKALQAKQPLRETMELTGPATRHLAVYVAPLRAKTGVVLVLNDTTELNRLEQLRQEFVANVSHELKTPLAVIQACVETLLDGAMDDIDVRGTFLAQIGEQAERLHALILDLISLARIESGAEVLEYEAVNISTFVELCVERQRPRAEAKQMTLEEVGPPEVTAWADAEAVRQILDNLVDNAVKYTPAGGKVWVSYGIADDMVEVVVRDSGPGIPARDLPRIFERFYRVDKARSRELGGTGLGLAIVKHLVQTMGGTIRVQSTVGQGTTFTVTLPQPAR